MAAGANNAFTGNNTHSGTETFSGPLVNTGTDSGNQTISGNKTVTGTLNSNNLAAGNVANKNSSSDALQYVSSAGNDSNDGLSWGTAKLTLGGACTALGGNSSCTTGIGTVFIAPNAGVGIPAVIGPNLLFVSFKWSQMLFASGNLVEVQGGIFSVLNAAGSIIGDIAIGSPIGTGLNIGTTTNNSAVLYTNNTLAHTFDTSQNEQQAGRTTSYNAISTAGQGFPVIQGITSQKAETGSADANVLTVTPAAAVGNYRACVTASVSSATAGVIGWTLSYTDSNGNAQANIAQSLFQQGTAAPALTFTTSAAGNYQSCSQFDVNNAGASIILKWVGGGTTAAKISATVERLI